LGIFLDEAANIAPLPNLPSLLSDAGGTGIHLEVILQSLAQARHRWGDAQASAMLDASTIKLILPGLSQADDLSIFSRLAGEQEIETKSSTSASQGGSETVSSTWRPRWSPDAIRGLRQFHALVMHRRVAPVEIEMTPYWSD
jgi:type IV secretory pathway TraG/TraD family ATPase VirD4